MKKIMMIILCLCVVSPGFAEMKCISSGKGITVKQSSDISLSGFWVQVDDENLRSKVIKMLTDYCNSESSKIVSNDKYDECIKEVVIEINSFNRCIELLNKKIYEIQLNQTPFDKDEKILSNNLKLQVLRNIIEKIEELKKRKVSELIDKLK